VTILYNNNVYVPSTVLSDNPPVPQPPPAAPDPNWPPKPHVRNANFYRVLSATTNPVSGDMEVELEVPLRPDSGLNKGASNAGITLPANYRRFVVLNGVAEVFELTDPVTAP
jgi:hypothetical protein